ncbi:response regulator receiver sensor signal transduction histidine kinase [Maricaulis maris]|uniref:histidine kinase n=1 Tax=Maricaulis maris TaxID=74318 RepID=A0A495D125_9PROT|nr:response regulator receiver sensor signal transduction histidine kinase [Maricaulis maris]
MTFLLCRFDCVIGPATGAFALERQPAGSEPRRFLIIDDDDLDRMVIERKLGQLEPGAVCCHAATAEDALRQVARGPAFDAAFVDFAMPDEDGLSTIRALRRQKSLELVPVIMVTGSADPVLAASAIIEGADAYLGKEDMTDSRFAWALVSATERARLRREARAKEVAMREFAFNAAHDLKSPLNGITGFATLLAKAVDGVSPQAREFAAKIRTQGFKMAELIDSMLDYAIAGEAIGETPVVALQDVVDDAVASTRAALDAVDATVHVSAAGRAPMDRLQVERVVRNLILNAVKYRSSAPLEITIRTREEAGGVAVEITDNGLGVPADLQDRIFEPMQRAHQESADGHGLGLAISRKIINAHGGRIWCEPRSAGGSLFTFTLPEA